SARGTLGVLRRADAVPQRRVRLLQWLEHERHVLEAIELTLEIKHAILQAAHQHVERLDEHLPELVGIDAVVADLDRRNALADAKLEAPAAHLVEYADFLDQPDRVIERQRVDERAEGQAFGALRHGRQEYARGGRHAERRRVMLGYLIAVE